MIEFADLYTLRRIVGAGLNRESGWDQTDPLWMTHVHVPLLVEHCLVLNLLVLNGGKILRNGGKAKGKH
jgi:hypothetical protein